MNRRRNFVLFCVTEENKNQMAVAIHSLSKHYRGCIVVAYAKTVPQNLANLLLNITNVVEYMQFEQEVDEEGLLIKVLQNSYDSDIDRLLFLSSNTVVNAPIDELLKAPLGNCIMAACPEYIYSKGANGHTAYRREDLKYGVKGTVFNHRYYDLGVAVFSMRNLRRSTVQIDTLFDRFWKHKYLIDLGSEEFLNTEFLKLPVLDINRKFNAFGDKFLFNIKQYHKSIRVNYIIKNSVIMNFVVPPWDCEFNRRTLQYPMDAYLKEAMECEKYLDKEFVDKVTYTGEKWKVYLGKLPEVYTKYFRR